jgi:hypothetical protein
MTEIRLDYCKFMITITELVSKRYINSTIKLTPFLHVSGRCDQPINTFYRHSNVLINLTDLLTDILASQAILSVCLWILKSASQYSLSLWKSNELIPKHTSHS